MKKERKKLVKKRTLYGFFGLLIVLTLFALVSYFVQANLDYLQSLISNNIVGMLAYVLILVVEIVVAPITFIPLIPLASALWGWVLAGILTLSGWTLGSLVAFFIARKGGVPLLEKFVSLEKIHKLDRLMFKKHAFLGIILLRLLIPIDFVSYALGLFTKVGWKKYTLATLIGYAPITFLLAYFGSLPLYDQILGFLSVALFILIVAAIFYKKVFK